MLSPVLYYKLYMFSHLYHLSCDRGGDCECLCTAIAAFAEACNAAGVEVYWRSQRLCRMLIFNISIDLQQYKDTLKE